MKKQNRFGDVTRCQSWSSWLYNLVSNFQLYTIYVIMWIKCARDIYISSFILKTLFFFKLFHDFTVILFIFKVTLYS